MFNEGIVGPQSNGDSSVTKARMGRSGEQMVSELQGRYYELAVRGNLFQAHAIVTAPVIYTTAAGTGGPLLYNGTTTHNAVILAVSMSSSVVTTVAAGIGLTGNSDQAAPGTTTAIDSNKNLLIGGPATRMSLYRIGTPTGAGNFFYPIWQVHTGALTVDTTGTQWVELAGCVVVPPRAWVSIAASATASTLVANFGLIYAEIPV